MKKISKIIIGVIIAIVMISMCENKVVAASTSISVPSSVESGDSVTVKVTLKNVAAWNISISATGATSGGTKSFADATEDAMNTTKTFTYTCQSTGEGKITISVTGDMSTEEGGNSGINESRTITVNKKKEETKPVQPAETTPSTKTETTTTVPAETKTSPTTSKGQNVVNNNNLNNNKINTQENIEEQKKQEEQRRIAEEEKRKQEEMAENRLESLMIDGYELTPEFNSDVDEYFIELPITEEKITINAKSISDLANIQETGEFNVNEGNNEFEIIIIAGNGEKRTYKINATVVDKTPIIFSMNGKEYTIIKRKALIINPDENQYTETIIKIDNIEISAFKNNDTDEIVIATKDENNETKYLKLQDIQETKSEIKKENNPYIVISVILGILLVISIIISIIVIVKARKMN